MHLEIVMGRLRVSGQSLNRIERNFYKTEIKILGNIVLKGTIEPDPEKIRAIKSYPATTKIQELRSFLDMVNYCREFICGFASIVNPLYAILKGEAKKKQ
ncbi:Retrovirus-related Pol polyprotein from transposon gypsy [Nosema granulosis]|uniref:Retrovirus-related Pol polyprotein from transposon gypsy n=1 Tax=Nosema granulosis TaxID=83296 RepID=A0A9P6KYM8_9MICR|nr:Retrovirus-related Pol polyprotein from transposon gypsy [Nosema granulosis]